MKNTILVVNYSITFPREQFDNVHAIYFLLDYVQFFNLVPYGYGNNYIERRLMRTTSFILTIFNNQRLQTIFQQNILI